MRTTLPRIVRNVLICVLCFTILSGCAASSEESSITVALIDKGVPARIEAFEAYDITIPDMYGSTDHATMMLSLILGVHDTQAIPAHPSKLKILSYAVPTGGPDALGESIIQAVTDGADLISISMGFRSSSRRLENAVAKAYDNGSRIFAAAGNNSFLKADYPARLNTVVSVGAIDANGQFWENSCRNNIDKKTLGVDVPALNADGISVSSSGTSVSTAIAVHAELLDMVKKYT